MLGKAGTKNIAITLGIAVFISGILQAILIINLLLLLTSLTEPNSSLGSYYLTSYYGAAFLLSLLVSYFADKTRKISSLILLLCAWSLGFCLLFLVASPASLKIFSVIFGMPPLICITSLLFSLTGDYLNKQQTIIIRGVFSFAFVIGPPIGTTLTQYFGYNSVFIAIIAGVLATVGIITVFKVLAKTIVIESHTSGKSSDKYINLDVLIAFCALIFLHGSMSVTSSFLPLLVKDTLGVNASVTGIALGLCAFVEISVIAVLAKYSGLTPSKTMLGGCIAGLFYFTFLVNVDSANGVIASQILNGAFIAVMVAIGLVWMQDIKGGGASIKTALFVNAYNVGAVILTPVVGYVSSYSGDLRVGIGSAIAGIVIGMALLLLVFYRQSVELRGLAQQSN